MSFLKKLILCLLLLFFSLSFQGCLGLSSLEREARKRRHKKTVTMEVTAYCPCGECCNWKRRWLLWTVVDKGPNKGKSKKVGICADGTKAKYGTIAADTRYYPFGTIMHVPGYGWGKVHDIGSSIKGQHIDLFLKHMKGHKTGVFKNKE